MTPRKAVTKQIELRNGMRTVLIPQPRRRQPRPISSSMPDSSSIEPPPTNITRDGQSMPTTPLRTPRTTPEAEAEELSMTGSYPRETRSTALDPVDLLHGIDVLPSNGFQVHAQATATPGNNPLALVPHVTPRTSIPWKAGVALAIGTGIATMAGMASMAPPVEAGNKRGFDTAFGEPDMAGCLDAAAKVVWDSYLGQ